MCCTGDAGWTTDQGSRRQEGAAAPERHQRLLLTWHPVLPHGRVRYTLLHVGSALSDSFFDFFEFI